MDSVSNERQKAAPDSTFAVWPGLTWARATLPVFVLTASFVLFRLPALTNAGFINSDGAVTGLQALQMLRGEWAWLHWGRAYLTSIDSVMATPIFALFGATPLTLMCATILGQMTSAWLAFATLRRHLPAWTALIATLPIVFMTMALNIYLFFHIRQWCLAIAMCSFFFLDGASESRWPTLRYFAGIFTGIMATFIDLYALQFMPGLFLFAFLCCLDGPSRPPRNIARFAAVIAGAAAGWGAVRYLEHSLGISTDRAGWHLSKIPGNLDLLWETCLPWLIGWKLFIIGNQPYPEAYSPNFAYRAIALLGAVVFAAVLLCGTCAFFVRSIPWKLRRLGLLGSSVAVSSLSGFLVSTAVEDMWAARFLAPVVLTLPFAIAPLAFWFRGRQLLAVLSPYLFAIAVGGWLTFGMFVNGPLPQRTPRGVSDEEAQVAAMLLNRGIRYGAAHYWLAYRLTFIFQERPIIVPIESEDRYPRYRAEFNAAPIVAYIFHPSQPWLNPNVYEERFKKEQVKYEKIGMFDFTIFIINRQL